MSTSYTKTIVCLANSRKPPSGRCVAGREIVGSAFGAWVRAVSARTAGEISLEERRYADGGDPSLLDIIAIEMKSPRPQHHQIENHVIDSNCRWVKQSCVRWQDLQSAVEEPAGPLWLNGHSTYNGQNDRVPESVLDLVPRSLFLIRPERLRLMVKSEKSRKSDFAPPRRRVRARFNLSGCSYSVPVTDPALEATLLARNDGEYAIAEALLCLSLSEVYLSYAYKLAAAVITPHGSGI